MYKVLVVDDEKWVRKGIVHKLESSEYSFAAVTEARDGNEALEAFQKELPDIVISDIRMDVMDGLEFIRKAMEIRSDVEFIIISGYSEFEYAKEAVDLGICAYLLKPLEDELFHKAVTKAIQKLRYHSELIDVNGSKAKKKTGNGTRQLIDVYKLLLHPEGGGEAAHNTASRYDQSLFYILAMLNCSSSDPAIMMSDQAPALSMEKMQQLIEEVDLQPHAMVVDNPIAKNQMLFLLYDKDKAMLAEACDRLTSAVMKRLSGSMPWDITFGISSISDDITNRLYREAKEAAGLRLVQGCNKVYQYGALTMDRNYAISEQMMHMLQNSIESYHYVNIKAILHSIFTPGHVREMSGSYMTVLFVQITGILLKACDKMGCSADYAIDPGMLSEEAVTRISNCESLAGYIFDVVRSALERMAQIPNDRKSIIGRVKKYIESHYYESLSVSGLSELYSMNADYLSTLYKEITGESIIKHLSDVRIANACTLLRKTNSSAAEIASSVGYDDTQYFYKVFKKLTGKTPSEYRNSSL